MARTIEIQHLGANVACTIEKVDRTSLYGSIDVETHDMDGRACRLATLAADGRTLIPSGNTAIAHLSTDGRWLERSDLIAQDAAGNRLNTVASSFSQPLELETVTTPSRFLDHAIRLAYVLDPVDASLPPKLAEALGAGAIFKTDFSYRGGISADPAFVMQGADGAVWLLVGDENAIDYVGLAQSAGLVAEEAEADGEDDLDFDMM